MTNKNINCHPELVEGSQQNCISTRDIAEDAKLNHKIAEELRKYTPNHQLSSSRHPEGVTRGSRWLRNPYLTWILRSSRSMTRIYVLLSIITLLPTVAQAETCTPTPKCEDLGYTQSSCPDGGGVKCPWNTSLMYCCKKCAPSCEVKSNCEVGDVLYSDKKCYTCPNRYILPGQVPIGVVFSSGKAVALADLSGTMTWDDAKSACSSYSVGGVSGWHLPIRDELRAIYNNRSSFVQGFSNAIGGKDFVSDYYWSASTYFPSGYLVINLVSGTPAGWSSSRYAYVRPVLSF